MTNPDTTQPTTAPDEFAPGDRVTILVAQSEHVAVSLDATVEFPVLRRDYPTRTMVSTGQYQVYIHSLGTVRVDADRLVAAVQ